MAMPIRSGCAEARLLLEWGKTGCAIEKVELTDVDGICYFVRGMIAPASLHPQPTPVVFLNARADRGRFTVAITPADETGYDITPPLNQIEITNHTDQEIPNHFLRT